ncbi:hypothetical protein QVD17_11916 [Tagetes erecta]|uniref:Uncharacterized protein n=1 Tax=Tagetes erecta TaxID=13708 RepID=A0AAD8KW16_TARER|nr:hypothetical protein QVD17_11916 [Tagetes erecta]
MDLRYLVDDQIQVKHVDKADKDNEMNNESEMETENDMKEGDKECGIQHRRKNSGDSSTNGKHEARTMYTHQCRPSMGSPVES